MSEALLPVLLVDGAALLFPTPRPPARDGLDVEDVRDAGTAGGPIDVRFPPMLGLGGFDVVMEGGRVVEGVVVLGVEAVDVTPGNCFVGDLEGDCACFSVRLQLVQQPTYLL